MKTLRNMNTVLTFVIMGLVCRLKAPRGGFRNSKFDLLHKYSYRDPVVSFDCVSDDVILR